jgi:membrane fusion protein (multidrug efflux system)
VPTPLPRIAIPALAACLAAGLCACGGGADGPRAAEEGGVQERELPSVRVARVEQRPMQRVIETTSKLESEREIRLLPRASGVVLELFAEEGDRVAKGALLAQLDDRDEALALRDAETALAERRNALELARLAVQNAKELETSAGNAARQAQRDYERDRSLAESKDVASPLSAQALEASQLARDKAQTAAAQAAIASKRAELEVTDAENAVARAEVALERARIAVEYMQIRAPFDALVAERMIRAGDTVGAGEPAFVLTDLEHMRVVFARPQEELELFARVGARNGEGHLALRATADAFPGHTFAGWIERISPTIEAESGQFRVTGRLECSLEGGRIRLLPGMLVRLEIVTDRHDEAMVVPKRALEREGERRHLLGVESGVVRRIDVDEGFSDEDFVEVRPRAGATLVPGDLVVVVGGRDLSEGDEVQVDQAPASEGPELEAGAEQTAEVR